MTGASARISRESRTLRAMVELSCRSAHRTRSGLCRDCQALLSYALRRLERCRFGEGKPTCARCPVHCYRPDMREAIRDVMRRSGPRMVYTHPLLAVFHLIDSRRGIQPAKEHV